MVINIKDLLYFLTLIFGTIISCYIYYKGGDISYFCITTGYITGYLCCFIIIYDKNSSLINSKTYDIIQSSKARAE